MAASKRLKTPSTPLGTALLRTCSRSKRRPRRPPRQSVLPPKRPTSTTTANYPTTRQRFRQTRPVNDRPKRRRRFLAWTGCVWHKAGPPVTTGQFLFPPPNLNWRLDTPVSMRKSQTEAPQRQSCCSVILHNRTYSKRREVVGPAQTYGKTLKIHSDIMLKPPSVYLFSCQNM